MLFGGIAHRRADHVAKHVDELEERDRGRRGSAPRRRSPGRAPRDPGHATADGLRPSGAGARKRAHRPAGLPAPGFELDSMVLCPEFLPRDQPQPARVAAAPRRVASGSRRRRTRQARRPRRRRASASVARCNTSSAPASPASAWTRRSAERSRPMRPLCAARRHRDPPLGLNPGELRRPSGDDERCGDDGPGDAVGVDELAHGEVAAGGQALERDLQFLPTRGLSNDERPGHGHAPVGRTI